MVYVSPERFEIEQTRQISREISAANERMQREGRECLYTHTARSLRCSLRPLVWTINVVVYYTGKYLLMAPGRWGSADPTKGIPVGWEVWNTSRSLALCSTPLFCFHTSLLFPHLSSAPQDIDGSAFIVESTIDQSVPLSQVWNTQEHLHVLYLPCISPVSPLHLDRSRRARTSSRTSSPSGSATPPSTRPPPPPPARRCGPGGYRDDYACVTIYHGRIVHTYM